MNRENISAMTRTGHATAVVGKGLPGHLGKEHCVLWIRERQGYLQGVTPHALYTIADIDRAWALDGDHATELAERVMEYHGAMPVLRNRYGCQ